jgi:hypothetical protein
MCPDGTRPSASWTECVVCPDGSAGSGGICVLCTPGRAPSSYRTRCEGCVTQTNYSSYSPTGVACLECPWPYHVNGDERTLCSSCEPGQGPNQNQTACESCTGLDYSPTGFCKICEPPNVAIAGRTYCSPTVCRPGTTCLIDTCDVQGDCNECTVGHVSMGGECDSCDGDGRVANPLQSMCTSCSPGLEPLEDRSNCIACTFNMFSQFGYGCVQCPHPRTVNADRSTCTPCAPGQGAVDPLWSDATVFDNRGQTDLTLDNHDWQCAPCVGTSYSATGVCCELTTITSCTRSIVIVLSLAETDMKRMLQWIAPPQM